MPRQPPHLERPVLIPVRAPSAWVSDSVRRWSQRLQNSRHRNNIGDFWSGFGARRDCKGHGRDHDTSKNIFQITFNGTGAINGGSFDNVIAGGTGADTLNGLGGNNVLTGGWGADVFKWTRGNQGSTTAPASDRITDFSVAQANSLDLRDLLIGEHSVGTSNLTQSLQFCVESGKLVLSVVHDSGSTVAATQKIVFDNFANKGELAVALGLASGSTDATILAAMVTNGKLTTDI